jgi:hypothetical protein
VGGKPRRSVRLAERECNTSDFPEASCLAFVRFLVSNPAIKTPLAGNEEWRSIAFPKDVTVPGWVTCVIGPKESCGWVLLLVSAAFARAEGRNK